METFHLIIGSWITYLVIAVVLVLVVIAKKCFFVVKQTPDMVCRHSSKSFQIKLDTILYCDRMRDSITLHPVIGAESLSQLEAWSDNVNIKEEKLKQALRQYFLTVNFKEVDRLAVEEIIKEHFLSGGIQLNSLKIEFSSLPESLTW